MSFFFFSKTHFCRFTLFSFLIVDIVSAQYFGEDRTGCYRGSPFAKGLTALDWVGLDRIGSYTQLVDGASKPSQDNTPGIFKDEKICIAA